MPPSTHKNALPLGSMLMEYQLSSVLGAGGFGITYLARDTNLEKDVAIKEYLPGAVAVRDGTGTVMPTSAAHKQDYGWGLERFIQEARTLARFSHANIVRVNRFFEANGTGYMVMDYEEGEALKAYLQRNPFPPEAALKKLLAPLLDGLEKVHAAGFLHRDIKPDNIFVRKDGSAVLIDFGSARQAVGGATQALTTIVSPGYAPFEQYTTTAEQGAWSDIYSLSGVLYFAVTGQAPPDAISRMKGDTMARGLGAARLRYSAPLIDAIAWGLALEEAARPRDVAQWRDVLFGQRSMSSAAPGGDAIKKPVAKAASAPAAAKPAAETKVNDQAARAIALATAMAESRQTRSQRGLPWRWLAPVLVVLVITGFAVRFQTEKQQEAQAKVRVIKVAPVVVRSIVLPTPPANANTVAPSVPDAQATDGVASQRGIEGGTPADAEAPIDSANPATDVQMQSDDSGLTREELARNFPRLSERFELIDTDGDDRISAAELTVAMSQQAQSGP